MENAFLKILNMSITAGWLILFVIFLRFFLKKTPKAVRCILWALVAIRLICPFSLESMLSLIPSGETVSPGMIYSETPIINSGIPFINNTINPLLREHFTPKIEASANPLQIYTSVAAVIWVSGVAVMLLFLLISYLRMRRRVRVSLPVKDNIFLCDSVASPFILGVFRPRIYLPSAISEQQAAYVIAHEKVHLKRLDYLWKPLGFLLLSVYWFHPLCWLGYILLCRDIELACDEKVITQMSIHDKKEYSETLLSCSISRRSVTVCPLAFGEVAVKERVRGILNYRKPAFWAIIAAIILCIITAVCFLTNPKKSVSGTDAENVGIRLIGMDIYGEKPYIEYELVNHRDETITFGYEFHIYRLVDGKRINSATFDVSGWNMPAVMLEKWKSFPLTDSLAGYDFTEKGTYRLEKTFSIGDSEHIAYIEFQVDKPKLLDKKINGSQYEAAGVVYDCGMYSMVPDNISFRLSISEYDALSVCEDPEENTWREVGKLEEVQLTEENFDQHLDQSPIWSDGYSVESLRMHNVRAWRVPGKMVYILSQNNGNLLMACGGDENHFRWIFGMRQVYYE